MVARSTRLFRKHALSLTSIASKLAPTAHKKSPAVCRRTRGFFDSGSEWFRLADDHQKR